MSFLIWKSKVEFDTMIRDLYDTASWKKARERNMYILCTFKRGGGEYICLYMNRVAWGTTWEAAHNDCHRKEDLSSRDGEVGQEGTEAGGLWWGLPFQCTLSLWGLLSQAPYANNTHLKSKVNKSTAVTSNSGIPCRNENEPSRGTPARRMKLTEWN